MQENSLVLINKPDDPPTYYSRSWRTTSTPDLSIATDDLAKKTTREVQGQLGGSDHKPTILHIEVQKKVSQQRSKPSWNYKKANWVKFEKDLDERCRSLNSEGGKP